MEISTRTPSTSDRGQLAAFLASRLATDVASAPAGISAALIEQLIADFEGVAQVDGRRYRVKVVSADEVETQGMDAQEKRDVVATLQEALPPSVLAAAGDAGAKDPVLLANLVADQTKDLGIQVQNNNLMAAMHKDLVQLLTELLPTLEQTSGDQAVLASTRALLDRALAVQNTETLIPAKVTPMRILGTIESVSSSHHEILMRYGSALDSQTLVRGLRVVGEAMRLLEDIHGPATPGEEEDDAEQVGERNGM